VTALAASLPPAGMPGLDPGWSRLVVVRGPDGVPRTWHVLDNGTPDPVGTLVCVHGNPTWSYLWRGLLAAAPPGWRVIAPDQLGMGYSDRATAPRRLADRVADLRALTEALGVSGPVVTVGHDWGGAVSLGWALAAGTQLRGVVLANTAVAQPPGDHGPALVRLANLPVLRDAVCVRTPTFVRAATALSRPALPAGIRDAFAAPYRSASRRRSVGDFVADIPFAPDHPSRRALEAIAAGVGSLDVPALLLWGPRDPVFGQRYLRDLLQRLPHANLHRYEGASHLLPEDAPEYAAAVARWVADLGAGPDAVADKSTPPRRSGGSSSGSPTAEPTSRHTLWSALERRAEDGSPAVVEVGGVRVSWAALARRVRELAVGLAAAGVQPGHRVALLVPPSAELTAAVYAVWRAGGVVVLADKGLGFSGMRRALRGASVDHVIGSGPGLAAAALMRLPGTRFAAGPVSGLVLRAVGASRLADVARRGRSSSGPALQLPPLPGSEDDCAVIFTSGATGPAKGVVYRHRQVEAQLELLRSTYRLTAQDRFVAAFAPFALLGPALGISTAVPDIDVTQPGSLTATDLAAAAAAVDATVVFASPAALHTVARTADDLPDARREALSTVRLLVSAGAPVPASLLVALAPVLPAAEAHTPYGMTEVLPVTDISLREIQAAGSGDGVCVGRPLPGVQVCVSAVSATGAADGTLASTAGVMGEVVVRAAHVKDRYDALWSTERASSRDRGWHRTGDVGHVDDAGRLWVEGRLVHVVTTADGVVTPVAVEQRIERLDGVAAAAVVGVGPPGSQVVVLVVVPSSPSHGSSPLASPELAGAVRGVAGAEVAAVLVRPDLPLDIRHASKVDRQRLARWATEVLQGSPGRWTGGRAR